MNEINQKIIPEVKPKIKIIDSKLTIKNSKAIAFE
jgi:hypothetical protein